MTLMENNTPSQTLYLNGLDDKINKQGNDDSIEPSMFHVFPYHHADFHHVIVRLELRRSLYCLFSRYGKILDIVALKTMKARGQAFIIFDNMNSSQVAIRALQGTLFYDRPLVSFCPFFRHCMKGMFSLAHAAYALAFTENTICEI